MQFSKWNHHIEVTVGGRKIDKVDETKFLGVQIDSKLNWKSHIEEVSKKLGKASGIIYSASRKLSPKTKVLLYNTLVLPHIQYGIEI